MDEPTIWDYIKARLTPWRGPAPSIPPAAEEAEPGSGPVEFEIQQAASVAEPARPAEAKAFQLALPVIAEWPFRSVIALALAIAAQISLEPHPGRTSTTGLLLYVLAFAWMIWATWRGEWKAAPIPAEVQREDPLSINANLLAVSLVVSILAYLTLNDNHFTVVNFTLWIVGILLTLATFWVGVPAVPGALIRLGNFIRRPALNIRISGWTLLVLAAFCVAVYFRAYHLSQNPPDMFSDHAEKLLDVSDLLGGQTKIFFERNTGREAIQFYLTALIIKLFGTGLTYISLKIGTVFAGIFALPFIYLLGKEIASRRVGLLAMLFAGIAYWPNVISRVGLRFPLYPMFAAPALYFLIRGIRHSNRNDYLIAGLFVGFGLHGYSPARALPLVVVAAVGIYLLHRMSRGVRTQTLLALLALSWVSLVVFLPLLRYITEPGHPDQRALFLYRSLTRISTLEHPLPGPPLQIFMSNVGNALLMFTWQDGTVWSSSIPLRPALDVVSAAIFVLGAGLLFFRYLRERHWLDLFLLLSIPLLMLPSILALAFPIENPALNRTGGAIVPVFIIVGIALDGLLTGVAERLSVSMSKRTASTVAVLLGALLFYASAAQNYDLVFHQYREEYIAANWNTSEMGKIMADFAGLSGTSDTGYVIPYPYWADTRLVGIEAGFPTKDYAIDPAHLADTLAEPRMKLFILNRDDQKSLDELTNLYPNGIESTYHSMEPDKDFLLFLVPPGETADSAK